MALRPLLLLISLFLSQVPAAHASEGFPRFDPDGPASERIDLEGILDPEFCSNWNPEYTAMGFRCCSAARPVMRRGRKRAQCAPDRRNKWQYCDEMTDTQKSYTERVQSGAIADVLALIDHDLRANKRLQSQCSVNTGFLSFGRRLVPSDKNRIWVSNPARCTNFGADPLVAMLEWVGRNVAKEYPAPEYAETRIIVGDLSAPRGGCIAGRGGRRAHSSHTSGLDADIGFLTVSKLSGRAPAHFHRSFDAETNWWLLKQMFRNPYACIKAVFLDRKWIRKIEKVARNDADWARIRSSLKHVNGHRDHFHIRVGDSVAGADCQSTITEEEEEEVGDENAA